MFLYRSGIVGGWILYAGLVMSGREILSANRCGVSDWDEMVERSIYFEKLGREAINLHDLTAY